MSTKRTNISDLPAEEQELTAEETDQIHGGRFGLVLGGGTETDYASDLTQDPNNLTASERDTSKD